LLLRPGTREDIVDDRSGYGMEVKHVPRRATRVGRWRSEILPTLAHPLEHPHDDPPSLFADAAGNHLAKTRYQALEHWLEALVVEPVYLVGTADAHRPR